METTVEETVTADKKKKNKKDRKKVSEEDDFVIPSAAVVQEAVSIGAESADNTPLKENTEALTVKVTKKNKKKDRNKKSEEVNNFIKLLSGGLSGQVIIFQTTNHYHSLLWY